MDGENIMSYILIIILAAVGYVAYRRLVRRIEFHAQIATEQLSMYCAHVEKQRHD
jgi:hypothetical protein